MSMQPVESRSSAPDYIQAPNFHEICSKLKDVESIDHVHIGFDKNATPVVRNWLGRAWENLKTGVIVLLKKASHGKLDYETVDKTSELLSKFFAAHEKETIKEFKGVSKTFDSIKIKTFTPPKWGLIHLDILSPQETQKSQNLMEGLSSKIADDGLKAVRNIVNNYLEPKDQMIFNTVADVQKNISILQERERQGDPAAPFMLGAIYFSGIGVEKNEAEGEQMLKDAANLGQMGAAVFLGSKYLERGGDSPQNKGWDKYYSGKTSQEIKKEEKQIKKAIDYLKKPAEMGDAKAQNLLGRAYDLRAETFSAQYLAAEGPRMKAREWYERAGSQGDREALLNLAFCCLRSPQNKAKSIETFSKLAEENNIDGFGGLGLCYCLSRQANRNSYYPLILSVSAYSQSIQQSYRETVTWSVDWKKEDKAKAKENLNKTYELLRKSGKIENLDKLEQHIEQEKSKKHSYLYDGYIDDLSVNEYIAFLYTQRNWEKGKFERDLMPFLNE